MATSRLSVRLLADLSLLLAPICWWQGLRLKRTTPHLPEAPEPRHGKVNGDDPPLKILGIGESPMAGVGLASAEQTVAAVLARHLADSTGHAAEWRLSARGGVTARQTIDELLPRLEEQPFDLAIIALGVNDTLRLTSVRRWRRDLLELIGGLERKYRPGRIVLAGVPPMRHFPALKPPLATVLGLRADLLDQTAADLAASDDRLVHVPMNLDSGSAELFCRDGFHPNARAHSMWAEQLADVLDDLPWRGVEKRRWSANESTIPVGVVAVLSR